MVSAGSLLSTEFGHALRQAREARSRSLAWLSAETKVNLEQLNALEQGDLCALPGGVFRRGIVRAYLQAVGLEEQEWMPRFQRALESQSGSVDQQSVEQAWEQFAENVRRGRKLVAVRHSMRWLGVLILFCVVLLAAWAVWHYEIEPRLPGATKTPGNQSVRRAGPAAIISDLLHSA